MYPSGASSTSTPAAPQASPRPWKGTAVLDTVRVSPDTFRSVMFHSATERKAFTRDNIPAREKPQKTTSDGVPLWSVKVVAEDWRARVHILTVSVPMHDHPGTKFARGDLVELPGLVMGLSQKPQGGSGFVPTWLSADGIAPASTRPVAA